jgi:predicted HNH restriction endonuclease
MRDRIRKEKCYKCEICDWKEEPGILEIHHKDGNPTNRSEDNLQLVCPNCHKMHHFRTKTGMFSTRPRWKTEPEKRMTKIRVLATRNMPPQMTIPM